MAKEINSMMLVAVGQNHAFYDAYEDEAITVGDSAIGPTLSKLQTGSTADGYVYARACTIFLESGSGGDPATDAIRIRYAGTDPTSTVGALIPVAMGYYRIEGPQNIQHLKMIKDAGTSVPVETFLIYEL